MTSDFQKIMFYLSRSVKIKSLDWYILVYRITDKYVEPMYVSWPFGQSINRSPMTKEYLAFSFCQNIGTDGRREMDERRQIC